MADADNRSVCELLTKITDDSINMNEDEKKKEFLKLTKRKKNYLNDVIVFLERYRPFPFKIDLCKDLPICRDVKRKIPNRSANCDLSSILIHDNLLTIADYVDDRNGCNGMNSLLQSCKFYCDQDLKIQIWYRIMKNRRIRNILYDVFNIRMENKSE